jgi:hypothetical protein
MKRTLLTLCLCLAAAANAVGAPIYRCGPGGKTYSQVPCADGTIVEATDPRTAAQRAEAKRFVEAERKRAADLERERKAAEKAAAKDAPGAVGVGPAASAADDGRSRKQTAKAAKDKADQAAGKDFTAVVPKATPAAR